MEDGGDGNQRQGVLDEGTLAGHVRRARRISGHSQRRLAAQIGVSASAVGRWETGAAYPALDELLAVLDLAGLRLLVVDADGTDVVPMREDTIRDRAGRRYPAHCDPRGEGWWTPAGTSTSAAGSTAWLASRAAGVPRVTYDRGVWRAVMRTAYGTPADHPTYDEVLASMRARGAAAAATAGPEPRDPETPPDPRATPD